jgi:prenyltransferase beta subunit
MVVSQFIIIMEIDCFYFDFSGGPDQDPHLATTYAAVMALCTLGTENAYNSINRFVFSYYC